MPILQLERQTQSVENWACSWQNSEKLLFCAPLSATTISGFPVLFCISHLSPEHATIL